MGFLNKEILLLCLKIVYFSYYTNGSKESSWFLNFVVKQVFCLNVEFQVNAQAVEEESRTNFLTLLEMLRENKQPTSSVEKMTSFDFINVSSYSNDVNRKESLDEHDFSFGSSLYLSPKNENDSRLTNLDKSTKKELFKSFVSQKSAIFCNKEIFGFIRIFYCLYERISKIYQMTNAKNALVMFLFILKSQMLKKIETFNQFEELVRVILGQEYFFLLNMDKTLTSICKNISSVQNDNISMQICNLSRNNSDLEHLYLAKFLKIDLFILKKESQRAVFSIDV